MPRPDRRLLALLLVSVACGAPAQVAPTRMICPAPAVAPSAWRAYVTAAIRDSAFGQLLRDSGLDSVPTTVTPVADSSLCARIAGTVPRDPGWVVSGLQAFYFGSSYVVYTEGPDQQHGVMFVDSTYQALAGTLSFPRRLQR
ncbi:MAG TPA: hypothetical protein VFL97_09205 [Nitrococcus sp.]|nr:hypothetical protein [Nitrococcus sp.]